MDLWTKSALQDKNPRILSCALSLDDKNTEGKKPKKECLVAILELGPSFSCWFSFLPFESSFSPSMTRRVGAAYLGMRTSTQDARCQMCV